MACALASHPDPFAILVQKDRNRHKRAGEEREQGRPANPEVAIRGPGEVRESRAEHGTDKFVSARRVGGICVCEVVQNDVLWVGRNRLVSMWLKRVRKESHEEEHGDAEEA